MAERPILFSAPMVRAILAGTKTQTRRVVKWRGVEPGLNLAFSGLSASRIVESWVLESQSRTSSEWRCVPTYCPYGVAGDQLWVRETFMHEPADYCWEASVSIPCRPASTSYRADFGPDATGAGWKPSIHMPRALSRITLEITAVRIERLQAISVRDAIAEGIAAGGPENPDGIEQRDFRALWESINGADSWDANPWVWVVEFKRAEAR